MSLTGQVEHQPVAFATIILILEVGHLARQILSGRARFIVVL
jgi:hypothetical protein